MKESFENFHFYEDRGIKKNAKSYFLNHYFLCINLNVEDKNTNKRKKCLKKIIKPFREVWRRHGRIKRIKKENNCGKTLLVDEKTGANKAFEKKKKK